MVRVVVDTNVFVSALISKNPSPPLAIYHILKSEHVILITSPALPNELRDVLSRERIVKLHKLTSKQIQKILQEIIRTSYIVSGKLTLRVIKMIQKMINFLLLHSREMLITL